MKTEGGYKMKFTITKNERTYSDLEFHRIIEDAPKFIDSQQRDVVEFIKEHAGASTAIRVPIDELSGGQWSAIQTLIKREDAKP